MAIIENLVMLVMTSSQSLGTHGAGLMTRGRMHRAFPSGAERAVHDNFSNLASVLAGLCVRGRSRPNSAGTAYFGQIAPLGEARAITERRDSRFNHVVART
jgi:hypothetical protein